MFKSIYTSFCICLQGTVFEMRKRKGVIKENEKWYYSLEKGDEAKPYILVAEEFKVRNDLITKLHTRDGKLLSARESSAKGRAKWNPNQYTQDYLGPSGPGSDPTIEVYYRSLGLAQARHQLHA